MLAKPHNNHNIHFQTSKCPSFNKMIMIPGAMEMEHYLEYIDNEVRKVIRDGELKKESPREVVKGYDRFQKKLPITVGMPLVLAKASSSKHKQATDQDVIFLIPLPSSKATPTLLLVLLYEVILFFSSTNAYAMTAIKIKKDVFYKKKAEGPRECKFKGSKEGNRRKQVKVRIFKPVQLKKGALMTIDEGQINWVKVDIDDSLYVYGKHGPQPQSPSPTVSNASSIVFSICPSNDSDGELGAVSDASSTHYSTCQSNDSHPLMHMEHRGFKRGLDIDMRRTDESVARTDGWSLLLITFMALEKSLGCFALKHLGQYMPQNTNQLKYLLSADHEEEVFSDADDDEMPEIRIYDNQDEVDVTITPTLRIHNAHPQSQILGDPNTLLELGSSLKKITEARLYLNQGKSQKPLKMEAGLKLCRKNCCSSSFNKIMRGVVVRKQARLVAQGHDKEEGFDYDEVLLGVGKGNQDFNLNMEKVMQFVTAKLDAKLVVSQPQQVLLHTISASFCTNSSSSSSTTYNTITHQHYHKNPNTTYSFTNTTNSIPTPTCPPPSINTNHLQLLYPLPTTETEPTTSMVTSMRSILSVHHHFSPSQEQAPSRMPMDDLLHTVPKLISRIDSLELDLKQTKLTMGNAIVKLVRRLKKLDRVLKRRGGIWSIDKGRRYKRRKETKSKKVVSSLDFQDHDTAEKVNVEQILQEEASLAEAIRLDSLQREEEAEQIHLDALLAQRIAEEEELTEQQKKRKAQVQFEAQHYTNEDWDLIRAKLEANAELSKSMLGSELQGEDFAKKMVDLVNQRKKFFAEERAKAKRNKPMTQSQLKTYMMNYLKNQGSWKLNQLRKLSFEEVKEEFDKLIKQIESFAPISFEATKDSLKRFGEELQTKTPKRLKEDKDDEAKDDEPTKKLTKRRKQIARKGMHTSVDENVSDDSDKVDEQEETNTGTETPLNPVPVAMKTPSVATYKIIKQGEKGVYQIVREDGTDIVYINFGAMLKSISRDDLTELYRIVMNRYGLDGPEDKLEKGFWKCLRIMFEEPLSTDSIWSEIEQQKIVSWRYYDTSRVHCLNLESMDVYLLSDRKYPLSAEVCKTMLKMKLLDGKMSEDCYRLLKMMEKQAGIRK
ncbi:hypothetical protein Tco_0830726 [Tanacetum coccineum]